MTDQHQATRKSFNGLCVLIFVSLFLPIAGSVVSATFVPEWRWAQIPFHATIEACGGVIALVLAGILLASRSQGNSQHHLWMAAALISMGILDAAHAMVDPGKTFVWFHSTATFMGGAMFALVWLPSRIADSSRARLLIPVVTLATLVMCIGSLVFPSLMPSMVREGDFTLTAKGLNIFGGIGFLAATAWFLKRYRSTGHTDDYLFACLCCLFGAAGILFELSALWDAAWWWWHLLRLVAYSLAVAYSADEFRKVAEGLRTEIVERKRAKEKLEEHRDLLENTVQKRTEELSQTNDQLVFFQRATESASQGIGWVDLEGSIVYCNAALANMLQAESPQEVIGQSLMKYYPAEQRTRLAEEIFPQVIDQGGWEGELAIQPCDSKKLPTYSHFVCIEDEQGSPLYFANTVTNLTEQKETATKLEDTQRQLLTVSRMAGMSEVATGVLHSVGNVLNSVNVSASLVADKVRKSRAAELKKAGEIVAQHVDDMATFVTEHPQGQHMATYMIEIGKHLANEQDEMMEDLLVLRNNIEHIKEIVAMQQSYARVSGVAEEVNLKELIEDALRMRSASFNRHSINVIREFDDVPRIVTERHKIVQIVVNLVSNAKHAISDYRRTGGTLTLRLRMSGEKRLQLEVTDDGVGISEENLAKIFSYGFTTKADGHGFGLHSSVLAAKELGGTLTVHSDGPGTGATFMLELPVRQASEHEVTQ